MAKDEISLWDTAGLLVNKNYSTPTVNYLFFVVQLYRYSGERVVERYTLVSQAEVSLISQVQAVSFYLVRCVGVSSVIGQNELCCDWSAWIRLGVEQGPKKGRVRIFVWVPSWALRRAADRLGCPHNIYIYKTRLASNEIFWQSNKIHREEGRAKDLSAPRCNSNIVNKCKRGREGVLSIRGTAAASKIVPPKFRVISAMITFFSFIYVTISIHMLWSWVSIFTVVRSLYWMKSSTVKGK